MYMDRTYVTQNRKIAIYDHGLIIFRDTIARHALVKDRLRNLLLQAVANERAGQLVERLLIKYVSKRSRLSIAPCFFCSIDTVLNCKHMMSSSSPATSDAFSSPCVCDLEFSFFCEDY